MARELQHDGEGASFVSGLTVPSITRPTGTDSHPARLRVVNLPRSALPDLSELDIDEVDVCSGEGASCQLLPLLRLARPGLRARADAPLTVSGSVNDREEEHRIGDLPMEPDVLVEGQEPGQLRSENHHQVAQDGQCDERSIVAWVSETKEAMSTRSCELLLHALAHRGRDQLLQNARSASRDVSHVPPHLCATDSEAVQHSPRENHTENLSVLRPASLGSEACFQQPKQNRPACEP